ncbi:MULTISPECIES: acyl-CoA dehydrogenase [Novosphingobium]|uniref:acyl-CoA dehydrogenase n=1 Tax=Novosphingobium sp. ST904 TaxID=1684385 RepID=UPI00104BDA40|nr:acyl-CoA dehydrogenase [Novosphingobium sp. ST904]TCM41266.1 alkylation response protein AidB-like acyl-CoA dehydrogenase [Novosphingobium sp. ST904]
MSSRLLDREFLDFLLHDWLDIGEVLAQPRFAAHGRETVDAVIDLSEEVARDMFLPHFKEGDAEEPRFGPDGVQIHPQVAAALGEYARLGFFSAGFPEHLGGLGLPFLAASASFAWFAAANIATSSYAMLTVANARLIASFGSPAQVEAFARPQIEGRWFGTMCLSEPQAGSDLGAVRTRAEFHGEAGLGRRYRLTGSKMWISGGEHDAADNIVHLVLAKVAREDGSLPDGTGGLSLFIVPRVLPDGSRNEIAVAGLNHKMGYRAIPNCLLAFGEQEGAAGWLVGEEGQGLRQMFMMMNEARISVGLGAAAIACRGFGHALGYAQERLQGRVQGSGSTGTVPIIAHADVRRMLLAQKSYAEGALALCLFAARLVDEEHDPESAALLALLTPVVKTFSSEFGLEANALAMQVHGGYGYTRDFDVEQLYRDNRLNPIHEGTTGIQALDLLGRKLLRGGEGAAVLTARIAATARNARWLPELAAMGDALSAAWHAIEAALDVLRTMPQEQALARATPFLHAFGHGVVGWVWLDLAIAARAASPRLQCGTLAACRYFFDCEIPRIAAWLTPCTASSDLFAVEADWL